MRRGQRKQDGQSRPSHRGGRAEQDQQEKEGVPAEEARAHGQQRPGGAADEDRRSTSERDPADDAQQLDQGRRLFAQVHDRPEAGNREPSGTGNEIEGAFQARTEALRPDLVGDHVQERAGGHRSGRLEKSALLEPGQRETEQRPCDARGADQGGAQSRGTRPAQIEERQHDRGGERRMVRDDGRLQIEVPARLRQRGDEGQPFHDRVEDERRKADLGGDAQAGEPAAAQEPGAERSRQPLEEPGQREARRHPQQGDQSLRGKHFRQEMERDDACRSRECERPDALEDTGAPPGDQRDGASEDRGKPREHGGVDHRRHLSQMPRSSRTCSCTRYRVARRTSPSARSRTSEWNSRALPHSVQTMA